MAKTTKTTTQLLAELKTLAAKAGPALYRRLEICEHVLNDDDWLAASWEGKRLKAEDALGGEYFPDLFLNGGWTLGNLLHLFREYDRATWEKHNYSVDAIQTLADEEPDATGQAKVRHNWKVRAQEAEEKVEHLEELISRQGEEIKRLNAELAVEKQKAQELRETIARLEGRLQELERITPERA